MRSISRHRFGTWLAFAALTLQIVLTFGHVHLDDIRPVATKVAVAHAAGAPLVQASRQTAPIPGDDDDGYCAICATIFLASTTFVPLAPPLPVPAVFKRVVHDAVAAFGVIVKPRRIAFQSRAPPLA